MDEERAWELIRRILAPQNDEQRRRAFADLHQLHSEWLYWTIGRYVSDRQCVEDLLQEIWQLILSNLNQFDPDIGSFCSWSCTIAIRRTLTYLRARQQPVQFPYGCDLVGDYPTPVEELEDVELTSEINEALLRLTEQQRTIVILKDFLNRTFREIGEILNLNPNTVAGIYYQALEILRDLLEDDTDTD